MSLLQHDITPIRESIYDTGIDGIKELNDHSADKSGIDESHKGNAKAYNFFNWLVLRLPAKEEMKKFGLIYWCEEIVKVNKDGRANGKS